QQPSVMRKDVARMVRAPHKINRLMPPSGPLAEIYRVVRHGREVVPLLFLLFPAAPGVPGFSYDHWNEHETLAGRQFDWNVEQQAAVALCRIYQMSVPNCPMYSYRATRAQNRSVKVFWLKQIAEGK